MKLKGILKILIKLLIAIIAIPVIVALTINFYVILSAKGKIINGNNYSIASDADCILVLGCSVTPDKTPSDILADRLYTASNLYLSGLKTKLLMSGDHRSDDYNEVLVMKNYALSKGIPAEDIFMDHLGLSTYESMYRAKNIFQVKKIVIVTQKYHLYRALYIADQMGIEAYGIASDLRDYPESYYRNFREMLARIKDFVNLIINKDNYYGGKIIPISGDGRQTEEKY